MKLVYGPSERVIINVDTKTGRFHWNGNVLTFEQIIPHWGIVRSIELKVLRDGSVAQDMPVSNIGITEKELDGKNGIDLQFEVQHYASEDVTQHVYTVSASVEFVGISAMPDIED